MSGLEQHLEQGGIVILSGDALRGGDLDLACAASRITPEAINFMARHGRGLICLGLSAERARVLRLAPQFSEGHESSGRPFGPSIEARVGISTGISAADRAHTIRVAVDPGCGRDDLVSPGHVFPLIADPRGPEARLSTLETGIDIIRHFGLGEGIVLCAMLREDGNMARIGEVSEWARENDVPIVDLKEWVETRA